MQFGVAVKDVALVDAGLKIVKVPDGPSGIKGFVKIRNAIVPVYGLASLLGYVEQEKEYLLAVYTNGKKLGMEVDSVDRIIDVEEDAVQLLPVLFRKTAYWMKNIVLYQNQMIFMIDTDKIITEEVYNSCSQILSQENAI